MEVRGFVAMVRNAAVHRLHFLEILQEPRLVRFQPLGLLQKLLLAPFLADVLPVLPKEILGTCLGHSEGYLYPELVALATVLLGHSVHVVDGIDVCEELARLLQLTIAQGVAVV